MNRGQLLSGSDIVQNHRKCTKELPEIGLKLFEPRGSWFEESKLDNAIDERYSLLKEPRIEKDSVLSVAKWDAEMKKAIVLKKKGKEWETYGHHSSQDNLDYLNPEEALFLIESNSLILIHDNIEVSVEISYSLLLTPESGCTLEQYRVFAHLSRLGYKLIRHKKPIKNAKNDRVVSSTIATESVDVNRDKSRVVEPTACSSSAVSEDVVMIDDSSSDSSNDEVVIVDVVKGPIGKEVIDILDDDSRDSDVVMLESTLVELPLENWPFVHRSKFLNNENCQNDDRRPLTLDPFIISKPEYEIFNDIPNVRGHKIWLYRPDEMLLPDGIWPHHFKYRIDLDDERNDGYRGRGGFRGRPRGRGWYLQRQVNQMKNYTISLMNMVSQLVGPESTNLIRPPFALFQGPNYRFQRGHNFNRGGTHTWGRISLNNSQGNSNITVSSVNLSDNEETTSDKRAIKCENEDVKPKRIKLESDAISLDSNGSIKIEPLEIKEEVKIEPSSSGNHVKTSISIASSNVKIEQVTDTNISETSTSVCTELKTSGNANCKGAENCGDDLNMNACDGQNSISFEINERSAGRMSTSSDDVAFNKPEKNIQQSDSSTDAIVIVPADIDRTQSLAEVETSTAMDIDSDNPVLCTNDTLSQISPVCDLEKAIDIDKSNDKVVDASTVKLSSKMSDISAVKSNDNATNVTESLPVELSNANVNIHHMPKELENAIVIDDNSSDNIVDKSPNKCAHELTQKKAVFSRDKIVGNVNNVIDVDSLPSDVSNDKVNLCLVPEELESAIVIDDSSNDKIIDKCAHKFTQKIADVSTAKTKGNVKSMINEPSFAVELSDDNEDSNNSIVKINLESKGDSSSRNNVKKRTFNDSNMHYQILIDNKTASNIHEEVLIDNAIDSKTNEQVLIDNANDSKTNEQVLIDNEKHFEEVGGLIEISNAECSKTLLDNECFSTVSTIDDKAISHWKQIKELEKLNPPISQKSRITANQNEASGLSNEDEVTFIEPLVQSEDCSSLDDVLTRLQIFGEYRSKQVLEETEEINVDYDVYLPNSPYYRNLPPDPDFRLIILRLEDSFPDAEQMIHLRRIYKDKTNFLFAVVLRESVAYYLYDNICLPVYNESL